MLYESIKTFYPNRHFLSLSRHSGERRNERRGPAQSLRHTGVAGSNTAECGPYRHHCRTGVYTGPEYGPFKFKFKINYGKSIRCRYTNP